MGQTNVWFASGGMLAIAGVAALVTIALGLVRRPRIPGSAAWLGTAGLLCLVLAAGQPRLHLPARGKLAVMVDLSPSTRTASFRRAQEMFRRLHELIGDIPYQLFGFAADTRPLDRAGPWAEMPAEQTFFSPVPANAIVLFSDARFDLPQSSPPVYVIADVGLEDVADAAVNRLQIRGDTLVAGMSNSGPPRTATLAGVRGPTIMPVGSGRLALSAPLAAQTGSASVDLNPGDAWPENDAMEIRRSPPLAAQLWWIGANSPNSGWRKFSPEQLPHDPAEFLAPSVIVLDNIAAAHLGDPAIDRIVQYVRDLGGSLLIMGGDRAFGVGEYPGTALEVLSPLSSSPPAASTRWILLVDSSGSMNGPLWQSASRAVVGLLPSLPPQDTVAIGQFAAQVRWWSLDKTAAETAKLSLPPPDAQPGGPTNLEAALTSVAAAAPAGLPCQLLLLSDCDASNDEPGKLIQLLATKKVHLQVLTLGHGSGLGIINRVAQASGGRVIEQLDPNQWVESLRRLMQTAMPPRWMQEPVTVQFINEAAFLGARQIPAWDRAWLKQDAQLWGKSPSGAMAAFWRVGSGCVAAIAFTPTDDVAEALARRIAQPPRDPRFSTQWDQGPTLRVTVDALDKDQYLNDLRLAVEIADDSGMQSHEVAQTAPGRYELSLPAPRQPAIVTLRDERRVIDRIAVAGRYAQEFDALGNDHDAMRLLADRTGGTVIWPGDHRPIDFHWPRRQASLTSWLSAAGAACIAAALLRAR